MQFLENFVSEAGADVANVAPAVLLAHREDKRSEKRACPPRRGKSRNDNFLAFRGFDFKPSVVRAPDKYLCPRASP